MKQEPFGGLLDADLPNPRHSSRGECQKAEFEPPPPPGDDVGLRILLGDAHRFEPQRNEGAEAQDAMLTSIGLAPSNELMPA